MSLNQHRIHTPSLGVWQKDWSGVLVPSLKRLAQWDRAGNVATALGVPAKLTGTASIAHAFTIPAENYFIDLVSQLASGTETITLLDEIGGTPQFTLTITDTTITANGDVATPPSWSASLTKNRIILEVRPVNGDVIAYAYYKDNVTSERLVFGATEAWTYATPIGAVEISAAGGSTNLYEITVAELAGVLDGDSISCGVAGANLGFVPMPIFPNAPFLGPQRSGFTHSFSFWLERLANNNKRWLHQGVPGHRLNQSSGRINDFVVDALAGMTDKYCVLLCGTNDINSNASLATMQTRLGTNLTPLAAGSVKTAVVDVFPRNGFDAAKNIVRNDYNAYLASVELAGVVEIAYLAQFFEDTDPTQIKAILSGDGTHPNWFGYAHVDAVAELYRAINAL